MPVIWFPRAGMHEGDRESLATVVCPFIRRKAWLYPSHKKKGLALPEFDHLQPFEINRALSPSLWQVSSSVLRINEQRK